MIRTIGELTKTGVGRKRAIGCPVDILAIDQNGQNVSAQHLKSPTQFVSSRAMFLSRRTHGFAAIATIHRDVLKRTNVASSREAFARRKTDFEPAMHLETHYGEPRLYHQAPLYASGKNNHVKTVTKTYRFRLLSKLQASKVEYQAAPNIAITTDNQFTNLNCDFS